MKKQFLLLLLSVFTLSLSAQRVFTEYFEDVQSGTDLEDYNDWYVTKKASNANGDSPVIVEQFLFYDDYSGSDIGKACFLDSLMGQEDATKRISTRVVEFGGGDTLITPAAGESMYAAFLVQILENSKNSYRDFFTWEGSTTSNWSRGRVFAQLIDGTDLQFAVSKNSSSDFAESEIYEGATGSIFMMVLEYSSVLGDANDEIKLYINPDPTKSASEQATVLINVDEQSDYNDDTQIKINLRQRGIGAFIGNIRVGTDWDEVLTGAQVPVSKQTVSLSNVSIYANNKAIVTSEPGQVQVYELTGRKVLESSTSGNLQTSLRSGMYIVRFKDSDNKFSTGKIIVK
jgi:hypothetical protein